MQTTNFKNEIIHRLFDFDFAIEHDILRQILDLPREETIDDLNQIIQSHTNNPENLKDEILPEAHLHALFILGEIEAIESIEVVLSFFAQSDKYLTYLLGDHLTETLWEPISKIARKDILQLFPFLYNAENDEFARAAVVTAICQHIKEYPKERPIVLAEFKKILKKTLSLFKPEKREIFDMAFIDFLVMELIDYKTVELIDEIKIAFEKGVMIDYSEWEEIEQDIKSQEPTSITRETKSIFERYQEFEDEWKDESSYDYFDDEDFEISDEELLKELIALRAGPTHYEAEKPFVRETPKVGRNEPCPCGSGKKYKKCCL